MDNSKINRALGTKWFTFYTKVRPWLSIISSIIILIDFVQYIDTYFTYWWLLLYFIAGITQPILAIIVMIKSNHGYKDFVRFVKGVLLFETINIPYQIGVQQYINNEFNFGTAFAIAIIIFIATYLLWYRLNVKYFEKRIIVEPIEPTNLYTDPISRPPQISNPNDLPHSYGNYNVYGKDIRLNTENTTNIDFSVESSTDISPPIAPRIQFCRKCGTKLLEDSIYCTKCGTMVITDDK